MGYYIIGETALLLALYITFNTLGVDLTHEIGDSCLLCLVSITILEIHARDATWQ